MSKGAIRTPDWKEIAALFVGFIAILFFGWLVNIPGVLWFFSSIFIAIAGVLNATADAEAIIAGAILIVIIVILWKYLRVGAYFFLGAMLAVIAAYSMEFMGVAAPSLGAIF